LTTTRSFDISKEHGTVVSSDLAKSYAKVIILTYTACQVMAWATSIHSVESDPMSSQVGGSPEV